MKSPFRGAVLAIALALLCVATSHGQVDTGSVVDIVTDPSGAVVKDI